MDEEPCDDHDPDHCDVCLELRRQEAIEAKIEFRTMREDMDS